MQAAPIRRRSVNEPVHIAPAHIGHRTSLALWWLTARWRNRQVAEVCRKALPPLARRRVRRGPVRDISNEHRGSARNKNSAPLIET